VTGSERSSDALAGVSDDELTADASLSRVRAPIALSSLLSIVVAFTDSVALGGLAARLTNSFGDADSSPLGLSFVATFPVIIGLIVTTFVLNFVNTLVRERTTTKWGADRRIDLIQAFRHADFPTQANYSGAGLSTAASQVGRASAAIGGIIGLINTGVRTLVYVGIALVISWQVSLIAMVTGLVLMAGLRQISIRTRRLHREMSRRDIGVGEEIGEMAISARELHSLNRWDELEGFLAEEIRGIERVKYRAQTMAGMVGPTYWMGTLLVGVAVAATAAGADTTTSGIAASGLLLIRSLTAAQGTQTMYQSYNDAVPYVDRTRRVIAELRRARRPGGTDDVPSGITLAIDHADLTYGRDVVVRDLDLRLDGPGGVAIIGPSGSGKSTTMRTLSGLASPARGTVSINGVPLDLLSGRELGSVIGLLPQDPTLLRGSLRSNLVRPDVGRSDEELWSAIEAVGLHDTVSGFAGHLDTPVGRAAEGFSGGELQRLGLARLLVNRPRVWLADEPTSALDRENSERALDLLTAAMDEHLVVVVTHRPELLHHCKRVVFMENGVVVDDGTLEEVAARRPFVASMIADSSGSTTGTPVSGPVPT
jgi:ABC-type multidrug transport system fused ATPase/permease subunit